MSVQKLKFKQLFLFMFLLSTFLFLCNSLNAATIPYIIKETKNIDWNNVSYGNPSTSSYFELSGTSNYIHRDYQGVRLFDKDFNIIKFISSSDIGAQNISSLMFGNNTNRVYIISSIETARDVYKTSIYLTDRNLSSVKMMISNIDGQIYDLKDDIYGNIYMKIAYSSTNKGYDICKYNSGGGLSWRTYYSSSTKDNSFQFSVSKDGKYIKLMSSYSESNSVLSSHAIADVNTNTGYIGSMTSLNDYNYNMVSISDGKVLYKQYTYGAGTASFASKIYYTLPDKKDVRIATNPFDSVPNSGYAWRDTFELGNENLLLAGICYIRDGSYGIKGLGFIEYDKDMNVVDYWSQSIPVAYNSSIYFKFDNNTGRLEGFYNHLKNQSELFIFGIPDPTISISGTQTNNTTLGINYSVVANGNAISTYQILNPDTGALYYSGVYTNWSKYFNPGTYRFQARLLDSSSKVLASSNIVSMTVGKPSVDLSSINANIGDNTLATMNISTNVNGLSNVTMRVVDANNTNTVYYNSSVINNYSRDISDGTSRFKVLLYDSGGTLVASSNTILVDKRSTLGNALIALKSGTIPIKILIIGDLDRYYENNQANKNLVSQIKTLSSGTYIIQNNTSPVLDGLLE